MIINNHLPSRIETLLWANPRTSNNRMKIPPHAPRRCDSNTDSEQKYRSLTSTSYLFSQIIILIKRIHNFLMKSKSIVGHTKCVSIFSICSKIFAMPYSIRLIHDFRKNPVARYKHMLPVLLLLCFQGEMHGWSKDKCDHAFYNDMLNNCRITQSRKRRHLNDFVSLLRHKFKRSMNTQISVGDKFFFMSGTICKWAAGRKLFW